MARIAWILAAVASGLTAACLLVAGPTVEVDRRQESCPGVIAGAEGGHVPSACEAVQTRWARYAAGAGLISVIAGTGACFRLPSRTLTTDSRQQSIDKR